jgi:WhiB family redox-sensing transcriptional regulator
MEQPDFTKAECLGSDPNMWVPEDYSNGEATRAAKAICATCVIKEECRDWAIKTKQVGIWGGLTDSNRRYLIYGRRPRG